MISVRSLSIPGVLQNHAQANPSAMAVVSGRRMITWGELLARSNRIANGLRRFGLVEGDRVALVFDNSPELLELILGTIIAGGVVVPLSGLMTDAVVRRMVTASGSRFAFVQGSFAGRLAPVGEPALAEHCFSMGEATGWADYESWVAAQSPEAPLLDYPPDSSISILYTSGTTGQPKGMEHSHHSRLLYPLVLGPLMGIGRGARTILATPMYHNGTWVTMLPTLYAGGCVVIEERFSPTGFQATVQRERCTHAFMVPTQLILLAADPGFDPVALATMKTIMISGAPLPIETLQTMRSRLAQTEICEIYGMGEGFMTFASNRGATPSASGSVGRPIPEADTSIRIVDEDGQVLPTGRVGEIVGTSALMLKGYWAEPEMTRQSLWTDPQGRAYLRSGDLGYLDEAGYLYLAGRKKDMIISGGVKIYATDVEEVFMAHPEVLEVAAIAIPHATWGETPLLLAIMRPSAGVTEDELKEWGNRQLGKAQRVSHVEFRSSFPRNPLEKILKRTLREPYWTEPATGRISPAASIPPPDL